MLLLNHVTYIKECTRIYKEIMCILRSHWPTGKKGLEGVVSHPELLEMTHYLVSGRTLGS